MHFKRSWFLPIVIAATAGGAGSPANLVAQTDARPRTNVVLLLADDLGYGDLSCYGCRDIKTPHIDRLAAQGVRFAQFYSNGQECTPTRAALLTGRYQQRVGGLECAIGIGSVGRYDDAIRLAEQHDLGLPAEGFSLPQLLKNAGYATAICGKWHLGYEDKFSPKGHGFDHALYALGGGMDYFHHVEDPPEYAPVLRLNGQAIRRTGQYFTDLVAEESERFIEAHARQPFFLYVPFTAPHAPYQGPNDEHQTPLPAGSPLWSQSQAPPKTYAAMVERLDDAVGRILAALDKHQCADRTLVIFTSDNGGTASARPKPFRGLKGSTFEGGIRVPCILRLPGVLPTETTTEQVGITMDLTATIAQLAGATPPADRPLEGSDLIPLLTGGQPPARRQLFWRGRRGERTWRAVRDENLKLVVEQVGAERKEYLFDLARDTAEMQNLIAQRGADAERLKRALTEWEQRVRPTR